MSYLEEDLLSISYLNDLLFCERRAALHLLEGIWRDNQYTVEGSFAHRNVDVEGNRKRGSTQNVTGLWVVSYQFGLIGKCDLVEFVASNERRADAADSGMATASPPEAIPYPVDFKRGKKRRWDNNEVQLCAQALCLEEMLGVTVPEGAIFHIKSQRRESVVFDQALRKKTIDAAQRLRQLFGSKITPKAKFHPKCRGCSLLEWCLPKALKPRATPKRYLESIIHNTNET